MRVLAQDREDAGLQSVFKSIFPITDLRENCSLEFVDYSIGNWECKCGRLVGLDKLGRPCTFCAATIITDPRGDREIHCPKCGHLNENQPRHLRDLRRAGRAEAQVRRGRVPGARDDVRRPPQGHHPPRGLGQGRGDRRQDHPRHQGAGGLLRRHPADDGERDLHHQRHGAGHRQPAPPLAGRLLLAAGEGPLRRPDHPLPRELGGVRVRRQEPAPRADRPQAQVPGLRLPAGAGDEVRRGDPQALLQGGPHPRPRGAAVLEGLRQPRRPQALARPSSAPRTRAASATRSSTPARRSPPPTSRRSSGSTSRRSRSPRPTSRAPTPSPTSWTRGRARSCWRATSRSRRVCSPWSSPRAARSTRSRCSSPSATTSGRCSR